MLRKWLFVKASVDLDERVCDMEQRTWILNHPFNVLPPMRSVRFIDKADLIELECRIRHSRGLRPAWAANR